MIRRNPRPVQTGTIIVYCGGVPHPVVGGRCMHCGRPYPWVVK